MNYTEVRRKLKESRLEFVGKLYKRGYSYAQIAKEINKHLEVKVTRQTIKNDCDTLMEMWREDNIKNIDDAIQKELIIIDDLISECWQAWNRSIGRTIIDDINEDIEDLSSSNYDSGDVRYIAEIRANLIERRKLLGLYSAEKREITGKDGTALFNGFDSAMKECSALPLEKYE